MVTEEFDFYNKTSIKSYNLDAKIRYQLSMLDALDAYTRRHVENVANITCRLCEKLKLDEGFTIYCTTCAYLHDIGKQFIPPEVLQKPGKLTDEEYETMKTHTTIGYNMCMKDPKLKPYAAGPLYHHEALNGTGYPTGAKGNKIPYEAQIIRVADEFEAITAKRQYKTHVGIVETLNMLIENAQAGKINKKVLRALFSVTLDDTEYEIAARSSYVDYLKSELKRIKVALKYYNKYKNAKSPKKQEYYKKGVKACLRLNENVDAVPQMYTDMQKAIKDREDHIKKLNQEAKQIRNLHV